MNHFSTTRSALLLFSALSPLDAGAFYCSTLTYTGASLPPWRGCAWRNSNYRLNTDT